MGGQRRWVWSWAGCCAVLGALALVVPAAAPAAFPGANGQIAFTSDRDGSSEIYTMSGDGSGVQRLSSLGRRPSLSGDGRRIVFESNRIGFTEIFVMNADGGGQANLTNLGGDDVDPSFSRDGTRVAYARNTGSSYEIFAMNADGSNPVNLSNHPAGELAPSFSPDAARIAFLRSFDVLVMNADGTNQTNLTTSAATETAPSFSPDGTRIAYATTRDGNYEIYVMNADGSSPLRLTSNAADDDQPAFSPDGTKIAFRSQRDGNAEVYVMNADGSGQVNVTNNGAADSEPDWGVAVAAAAPLPAAPGTATGNPAPGAPTTPPPAAAASGSASGPVPPSQAPAAPAVTPPAAPGTLPSAQPPLAAGAIPTPSQRRAAARRRARAPDPPAGQGTPIAAQPAAGTAATAPDDELQPSPNPHRSTLSAFFVRPDDLFLSRQDIERSLAIGVLLALLLGLPARLFNKTVQRNRAELAGWFAPLRAALARITPRAAGRALGFAGVSVLLATTVYVFLDPRFPNRQGAAPYALGMLAGVAALVTTQLLCARLYVQRHAPDAAGGWVVYPGQVAVSMACVAVSRLANFVPGLLFGMAGDYESRRPLSAAQEAAASTWFYSVLLVLGLGAWFASIPVADAADGAGAGFVVLALDAALAVVAIGGMQAVAFGLIPLMFLDGAVLFRIRRGTWLTLWTIGLLWLAIVVINPALSHHGEQEASVAWLAGLLAFQGLVAGALWSFFVMRRRTASGRSAAHA